MKKDNNILKVTLIGALMMLATGCSKDDEGQTFEKEDVMTFEAVHPAATRVSETQFEAGDRIGVYVVEHDNGNVAPLQISGNWANNVPVTFDGKNWTNEKKIFWPENTVDVYAYYPYMTPTSIDENPFSVALDQNADDGYEKSDFLWAKTAGATQTNETVALGFSHRCSKLVVELVKGAAYEGDFPEVSDMYLHSTVPSATIDFTTGAVTKYTFGEMSSIKMKRVDNGHFEAIVIPQRVDARLPLIELVTNGVSYLIEDTFNFKAGKQHTIRIILSSNPEQIQIEIGGKVNDGWN